MKRIFCITLFITLFVFGCAQPQVKSAEPEPKSTTITDPARFEQKQQNHQETPVESAIELSKKFVALSEKTSLIEAENKELKAENASLKKEVTQLSAQNIQLEKELTDANELLLEMRIELNSWKSDILGYRDEMRQAQNAQLNALAQILQILGGEIVDAEPAENTQSQ